MTAPPNGVSVAPASELPPKIDVKNLSKSFSARGSEVVAIEDLSLTIGTGEFFSIVGPSGCGKTTLLRILAGLDEATTGEISVNNPPEGRPANSMIFQGESIFPWMSVWDNAAYGLRMRGESKEVIDDRVGHFLDKTGLTKFVDAYPHQLSGGMKQRVSIARAFANDPDVLLMDEPFSALDEQNKTLLQSELLRIWDETQKTVVFITHSVDEAVTLSDRILVMTAHPGRAKAVIDVPFPRPRSVLELRSQAEYGQIVYDIWQQLRDEVGRSQGTQPNRQQDGQDWPDPSRGRPVM